MKISFITTVFNEEETIDRFLRSLANQTKLPDEVIIVDGGSTDKTLSVIKLSSHQVIKKGVDVKVLVKRGNRSVGRNAAIKKATGDIIVCSDSGNVLDKKWLENITRPFFSQKSSGLQVFRSLGHKNYNVGLDDLMTSVDVVAGYYKGLAKNVFQKCLVPYALVMPDKVDPDNFLPATRSIAFTKAIWKKVGGFDEKYSHNEDYVFANKLKEAGATIVFAKDAIVNWIPRSTYKEAFVMFFRFALGDAEAGIWRTKVLLLFARYFLAFYFIFLSLLYKSFSPLVLILISFICYVFWSIKKNYRYVKDKESVKILPRIQLTADVAVLYGTVFGGLKSIRNFNYFLYIKQNKFLFLVLSIYVVISLFTLKWGIPNQNHPYPYQMDEWHQLQAVANTFRYGTPNTAGSANGTMFHFLLSGFYLIPFAVFKIVDPFALQIDNWVMRERIFEILRFQTILFGIGSILLIYKIADLLKASKKLAIVLFTFTPIWLLLSGYFKYDIALMFWILLSLLFFLRFAKDPSNRNFLLAAVPTGLAIAVKVSAIPLVLVYIATYFWFHPHWKKKFTYLCLAIAVLVIIVLLFGMQDTLFQKGNILDYLNNNIIDGPKYTSNFLIGESPYTYLFFYQYPMMFGYGVILLFILSVLFFLYFFLKEGIRGKKVELFLFLNLILFIGSTLSLQIGASGNRSLVALPFLILLIVMAIKKMSSTDLFRKLVIISLICIVSIQMLQSIAWINLKLAKIPQETSSLWIKENIPENSVIGVENIPIYQYLPNIIQQEYYFQTYKVNKKYMFNYQIIDSESKNLPKFIIITNEDIETKFLKESAKKSLMNRMKQEGYKKIAVFSPDLNEYRFVGRDIDYYISGILTMPLTISVYRK